MLLSVASPHITYIKAYLKLKLRKYPSLLSVGGSARSNSMEGSNKKHRPHITVGKDAEEAEGEEED